MKNKLLSLDGVKQTFVNMGEITVKKHAKEKDQYTVGYTVGYEAAVKDFTKEISRIKNNLSEMALVAEPEIQAPFYVDNSDGKPVRIYQDANKWSREAYKRGAIAIIALLENYFKRAQF